MVVHRVAPRVALVAQRAGEWLSGVAVAVVAAARAVSGLGVGCCGRRRKRRGCWGGFGGVSVGVSGSELHDGWDRRMAIVDEGGDEGGGQNGWARRLKVSLLAQRGLASSRWVRCVCTCWVEVVEFSLLTTFAYI